MNTTVKDFTDIELKAMAYENVVVINQHTESLRVIQAELALRVKPQDNVVEVPSNA